MAIYAIPWVRLGSALVVASAWVAFSCNAEGIEKKFWEYSPYTIRIQLAVDDSARPGFSPDDRIAEFLRERILATLHPLWSAEVHGTRESVKHNLIVMMDEPDQSPPSEINQFDKQLFLTLVAQPRGIALACREWDRHCRRWGPVMRERVRQETMLPERCFFLLTQTFSPLAKVRIDAENVKQATLVFKGSGLLRRTEEANFGQAGDIFKPVVIRSDHTGKTLPNGVSEIPWTYLSLTEPENGFWKCDVTSGLRRPFGIRRRGRTEHVAIALHSLSQTTSIRFHARHNREKALTGYEVYRRRPGSLATERLGLTNALGMIQLAATDESIVTLLLRSEGQLLAKVPIVPGSQRFIEVPIADEPARLRAQAELTALHEQLIDLVARRNILIKRIRRYLKRGQLKEARVLLTELDNFPSRAQFNQRLSTAERDPKNHSDNAQVQRRIEKIFAETRKLLGRFLDARQISDLRNEVLTATRSGKI